MTARWWIATGLMLLLVNLLVLFVGSFASAPELSLILEPGKIDLGTLKCGSTGDFQFSALNPTAKTVDIKNVTASCGCTKISVDDFHLPPGSRTKLSGQASMPLQPGLFQSKIWILAADQQFIVPISAEVIPWIDISPKSIMLRPDFDTNRSDHAILTIQNQGANDIEILNPIGLPEGLTTKIVDEHVRAGGMTTIEVSISPQFVRREKRTIKFGCKNSPQPSIDLSLDIHPHDELILSPDVISLGVVTAEDFLSLPEITIRVDGPMAAQCDFKNLDLPKFFKLARLDKSSPKFFEISLLPNALPNESDLSGAVTVVLQDRRSSRSIQVEVPVSGFLFD